MRQESYALTQLYMNPHDSCSTFQALKGCFTQITNNFLAKQELYLVTTTGLDICAIIFSALTIHHLLLQ